MKSAPLFCLQVMVRWTPCEQPYKLKKNHSRFQDLHCLCSTSYCVRATEYFRGLASFKTRATDNSKNNYVLFTYQWDSWIWILEFISLHYWHPNDRVLLRKKKEISLNTIHRRKVIQLYISSWIVKTEVEKSRPSLLTTSNRKCFQSVLGFYNQSASFKLCQNKKATSTSCP